MWWLVDLGCVTCVGLGCVSRDLAVGRVSLVIVVLKRGGRCTGTYWARYDITLSASLSAKYYNSVIRFVALEVEEDIGGGLGGVGGGKHVFL